MSNGDLNVPGQTMETFGDLPMLIGGKFVPAASGEWMDSVDPATEEVLGRSPAAGPEDVEAVVEAGESAFKDWRRTSPYERASLLRRFAALMLEHEDALARVESLDTGNPLFVALGDIRASARSIEYFAGLTHETKGETMPSSTGDSLHMAFREPFGLIARILPFNHPLLFSAMKMAAPLAAGNTVVIKPSEQSPLSSLKLAELCAEVFPPGVVNFLTGSGPVAGEAIVRHPAIRRLAFIGSVGTGLHIQRSAAETAVKHVTLELGGKNPMVVFPDADLARAVESAVFGMNYAWQGQSCGSTSRVFIHESVYEQCVADIAERVSRIRVGHPLDPSAQMGPINSRTQYEKDLGYIESATREGARLVAGGGRPQGSEFQKGYWLQPTVFADVTRDMTVFREEVFGPIMSIIRWKDRDDVIEMANAVEYGLTASIWTRDLENAIATARSVDAGYTWINGSSTHHPGTSFGGVKNSGVGREEGLEELLSYTEMRTLHLSPRSTSA